MIRLMTFIISTSLLLTEISPAVPPRYTEEQLLFTFNYFHNIFSFSYFVFGNFFGNFSNIFRMTFDFFFKISFEYFSNIF